MKSIEELIKELTPIEKVQTLIDTPIGRRKYPKGIILLAQSLKRRLPNHPQNNTNIHNIYIIPI